MSIIVPAKTTHPYNQSAPSGPNVVHLLPCCLPSEVSSRPSAGTSIRARAARSLTHTG